MRKILLYAQIILVIIVASGCSTAIAPNIQSIYTEITQSTLSQGDTIPAPAGDIMLSITGKIGTENSAEGIQMDRAAIEALGIVEYAMEDPFEKRDTVFRGVLMSDLLDLWQVDESATTLHMIALNDYAVDVPIADIREFPIIFAMMQDGDYMERSYRGPAMLVYPYAHFDLDPLIYERFWIWQIDRVEVR